MIGLNKRDIKKACGIDIRVLDDELAERGCYIMLNTDVLNDVMFQRGKVLEYE